MLRFPENLQQVFCTCRVTGWRAAGRPVFDINNLAREVAGNTVPLPKTLLKLILTMVVPRVILQKVQALLPVELGDYLSRAQKGVHVTGDPPPPNPLPVTTRLRALLPLPLGEYLFCIQKAVHVTIYSCFPLSLVVPRVEDYCTPRIISAPCFHLWSSFRFPLIVNERAPT